MNLVQKFQERLQISKEDAACRLIAFCLCAGLFAAIILGMAIYFPYASAHTEKVALLPGNHIQVQKILDGDVIVEEADFLRLASHNKSFVALEERQIVYMTKIAGVSYRYNQAVPLRNDYTVYSQQIENGMAVREIKRNLVTTAIQIIVVVLIFLLLFLLAAST